MGSALRDGPLHAACIFSITVLVAAGCARGSTSGTDARPHLEPKPTAAPTPASRAANGAAPLPDPPAPSCLTGIWTQEPATPSPPAPNACVNCPKTTYELSASDHDVLRVREGGIVRRSGQAKATGDDLVFELTNDHGAIEARFSCRAIEACRRLKCTWSQGGAGESVLVKAP
jgi:hypothetical protein